MTLVTKTVKIPRRLAGFLVRMAKKRGCSQSDLIREGIEKVTLDQEGLDMETLIRGDIGVGSGPSDLSHNRNRLKGYGCSRDR